MDRHAIPTVARRDARWAVWLTRARGNERPDSDTDIMIEIDPEAPVGIYEYVGIKEYIASLFDGPADEWTARA
jgi:predicted nucleotidyltransferase